MPKNQKDRQTKVWLTIFTTLLLLGAIVFTQFAANNSRSLNIRAAGCASGENVTTLRPNADFYNSHWSQSPNSGSLFDKVDEAGSGDGDGTFIWDDTANPNNGLVYFSRAAAGLNTSQVVKSVSVSVRARRVNGTSASIEPSIQMYGANFFGTAYSVSTSYSVYTHTWLTDPFRGGINWILTDINPIRLGARSTRAAQGNAINVTQIWMDVCWSYVPPSVSIKASPNPVNYNSAATLSWSSTNATSCPNYPSTNGSSSTGNLTAARSFSITCSGPGGQASAQVTVSVNPAPPPSGGGTKPAPKSTPKSTPKTAPTPSTSGSPAVNQIILTTGANSFLVGNKEIIASIEGTSNSKKLVFSKDSQNLTVDTSGLVVGQTYSLNLKGDWLVPQILSFQLSQGASVQALPLLVGDLTTDKKIDASDAVEFLNGFINDTVYDLNTDGVVNSFDYSILINNIK